MKNFLKEAELYDVPALNLDYFMHKMYDDNKTTEWNIHKLLEWISTMS